MQGYIIDIKAVKDDDLIVSILAENEVLTTYRFYGNFFRQAFKLAGLPY